MKPDWTPEQLEILAKAIEAGGQLWLSPHEMATVAYALRELAKETNNEDTSRPHRQD